MPTKSTPSEPPPAVVVRRSENPIWRVGSLVYSRKTLAILFFWLLLGDFAWSMRDRSVGSMAAWYVSHLGVSNFTFALLTSSIPALLGMTIGPIVSVMSDRHRGKRGRRIPFLLFTTPFAAAGMIGLGLTPLTAKLAHQWFPGANETVLALMSFCMFWAAFEVATIAGAAVFGGLLNDVVPPSLIGRFHGLFRAISLIDGMIFNYWLMGRTPDYFTVILIALGAFYGTAFMLVCLKVKEGDYPPPEGGGSTLQASAKAQSKVFAYLRSSFTNPYYLSVFLMMMLAALTFAPVNGFSIRYALHLKIDMDTYGKLLALTYFISLILAYPLGWLADIFHPLRMAIVTLGIYVVAMIWAFSTPETPEAFLIALLLHGICSGSYFTCAASLGNRLFPASRFAQYASAAGILLSLSGLLLPMGMGAVIDWGSNAYHLVFLAGGLIALLALAATQIVYRQFLKFGGPSGYVAPEDDKAIPL